MKRGQKAWRWPCTRVAAPSSRCHKSRGCNKVWHCSTTFDASCSATKLGWLCVSRRCHNVMGVLSLIYFVLSSFEARIDWQFNRASTEAEKLLFRGLFKACLPKLIRVWSLRTCWCGAHNRSRSTTNIYSLCSNFPFIISIHHV